MARDPVLRLVASQTLPSPSPSKALGRSLVQRSISRPPPIVEVRSGAVLVWIAMGNAVLAAVALFVPTRATFVELFLLSSIVCCAGLTRLVIASFYRDTQQANAYAIWAVVTTGGAALFLAAPFFALASPMAALAFVLALEAGAAMNVARASDQSASAWIPYAMSSAVLALAAFLLQTHAPVWMIGGAIALDLAIGAWACMRAGLALPRRL